MPKQTTPAKSTIAKLRENGFVTDNAITVVNTENETAVVPLEKFIGISSNVINGSALNADKLLSLLKQAKEMGIDLSEILSKVS